MILLVRDVLERKMSADARADLERAPVLAAGRKARERAMIEALHDAVLGGQQVVPREHKRLAGRFLFGGERRRLFRPNDRASLRHAGSLLRFRKRYSCNPATSSFHPDSGAVSLAAYDTASKAGFDSKKKARKILACDVEKLCDLQDKFAAQTSRALLIVLQGMDAAGKDGIIKHVMTGLNPQGVNVYGFRAPTTEETRHDFLWRESKVLPERGRIAIFNRSYYEEVLVVRVHPEILQAQGASNPGPDTWAQRYEDINAFERHLTRCGTIVLKFCLHLSKEEQRERLLCRLETPDKMWKASDADLVGHSEWDAYVKAYEAMLSNTSTPWAPGTSSPPTESGSRARWSVRSSSAHSRDCGLKYPQPSPERREKYAELAKQMEAEP